MAGETSFDYYHGDEGSRFSFYRIPCQLVAGERFKRLSTDAKLLSELETGNGFGLIERVKQGQGRPA